MRPGGSMRNAAPMLVKKIFCLKTGCRQNKPESINAHMHDPYIMKLLEEPSLLSPGFHTPLKKIISAVQYPTQEIPYKS